MNNLRANDADSRFTTLKRTSSWFLVAATVLTLGAFWNFLVFHWSDANPPLLWIYCAGAALAIAVVHLVIYLLEWWTRHHDWRFSLRDTLVAMTVIAIVLGIVVCVARR